MAKAETYLATDLPSPMPGSVGGILLEATRLYFASLPFIFGLTLLIYIPAKLALVSLCAALDLPPEGVASYLILDAGDIVFGSLLVPALIYGLMRKLRTGAIASPGDSLRWGLRQWGKALWNTIKAEITIGLYMLLLIVPGIIASIRLIFVDTIVAIEADRTAAVLERSREVARGRGWFIFFTLLPAVALNLVHMYASFRTLKVSAFAMVPVDAVFSAIEQWTTVVALILYLAFAATAPSPTRDREQTERQRRAGKGGTRASNTR